MHILFCVNNIKFGTKCFVKVEQFVLPFILKGHYNTSCFIERNGKFVYISHSSGLSRMGSGVKIELDSFLIRTAQHAKDYRGGHNQYCDITNLQSMIDNLLE